MNKVLVIDQNAAIYRDRLQAEFPTLQIAASGDGKDLPQDLSDFEILISFCMGLPQDFFRRATGLKWVQCLATGVDHLLRQPDLDRAVVLTSGRGVHGAPMRETVLYLMQGVSRDVARRGTPVLQFIVWPDRGCGRDRRCRHYHRATPESLRHARDRRDAHAAPSRRLR